MKNARWYAVLLIVPLVLSGCSLVNIGREAVRIDPSGNIVTEARALTGEFDRIEFETFGTVEITQGDPAAVTVEGSDNIVEHIRAEVSGGTLTIDTDEPLSITGDEGRLTFRITTPDLTAIVLSGAGDIRMATLTASDLEIDLSGAGNIEIGTLQASRLDVRVAGMGDVALAGRTQEARIEIPGAGSVDAPDLQIDTAEVNVQGLGDANVWVTGSLSGSISGAGTVSFWGSPQVDTDSTGLGSWKSLGDKDAM